GGDHHVINRPGQIAKELRERGVIARVKGRTALRFDLCRSLLQTFRIPAGQNQLGALRTSLPGGLQAHATPSTDHHHSLSRELRHTMAVRRSSCSTHFQPPIRSPKPRGYSGSFSPDRSRTMYSAYHAGQFSSRAPRRFSCSPCAASARRMASARSFTDAKVVAA